MAWIKGTYNCGCEGRVDIIGPKKERRWKADRHFDQDCYECVNKRNKELAEEAGLPNLSGSEKQIAWATSIRQDLYKEAQEFIETGEKQIKELGEQLTNEQIAQFEENVRTIEKLFEKKESKYWIDNRGLSLNRHMINILDEEEK